MSPDVFEAMAETRAFLFESVYIGRISDATKRAVHLILTTLLQHHAADERAADPSPNEPDGRQGAVDYVAGMTDRFALRRYSDLVGEPPPDITVLQ
jgi:dGTPase